jgi:hypothetical protein
MAADVNLETLLRRRVDTMSPYPQTDHDSGIERHSTNAQASSMAARW